MIKTQASNELTFYFQVKTQYTDKILHLLRDYDAAKSENRLLSISFTSLADYMWYLRLLCERISHFGPRVLLYLAAAVSDFYIPASEMPEHKMQSSEGAPKLQLQLVPKMLRPLVKFWVPKAYTISFKLETDPELLETKAKKALENYNHQLVIANLLHDRKRRVKFVGRSNTPDEAAYYTKLVELSDNEFETGVEIEEKIIGLLYNMHKNFCETSQ